jgi:hypothetical protein
VRKINEILRLADARDSRALARRLKTAKLRYPASIEDLDLRAPRVLTGRSSPTWPAPPG